MDLILVSLIGEKCLAYVNDILVFGKTEAEHDANLKLVDERLKQYEIKQIVQKKVVKRQNVAFLGYDFKPTCSNHFYNATKV